MPDLTTLGKVIGGGMPVGAFGGRRDIMEKIAPLGPVYQAGTLSGNPVAVAAGLATLAADRGARLLRVARGEDAGDDRGPRGGGEARGRDVLARSRSAACSACTSRRASPRATRKSWPCDKERFNRFFHHMLDAGIYLAPSAYEAGFVSAAHGEAEIAATIAAAERAFAAVR